MIWTKHRKDVLRGIYQLENGEKSLRVVDLAYALNFNRNAVDRTLIFLQEQGFIVITKMDRVCYLQCTQEGRNFAMLSCSRVRTRDHTKRVYVQPDDLAVKRYGLRVSEERYLKMMEGVDYSADNIKREVLAGGIPHRELTHSGCGSSLGGV